MPNRAFKLLTQVSGSSSSPKAIEPVLKSLIKRGTVRREKDEFIIEAEMEGASARELNRSLPSELRRVERKTRSTFELDPRRND